MKKYLLVIAVMAIALSLSAFNYLPSVKDHHKTSHRFVTATYHYVGTVYTDAEYNKEANWLKGTASCGVPGSKLCTIVAPDDGSSQPDFSALPVGGNVRTDNTIISNQTFKQ